MKDITFKKLVDVGVLHQQLVAAGFDIYGVSYDSGTGICTVHLKDTETKDPTSVVNAYVYTTPAPPEDFKAEFSAASTTAAKLQIIAKRLGLI